MNQSESRLRWRGVALAVLGAAAVAVIGAAEALAVRPPARGDAQGATQVASAAASSQGAPIAVAEADAADLDRGAVALPERDPTAEGDGMLGGDAVAGQRVAMGRNSAGMASACFRCHGLDGGGDAGGAFPRLAGQPAFYLYKQLVNYSDGSRPNDVMTPIALQLTPQERRDVAAFYSAAAAPYRPPPGRVDARLLQRGATLAAVGSQAQRMPSCVSCHGPEGRGLPPNGPSLAGQDANYLMLQLQWWAEGRRRNDALGVMADVARALSDEDRRAVSAYFASVPPAAP